MKDGEHSRTQFPPGDLRAIFEFEFASQVLQVEWKPPEGPVFRVPEKVIPPQLPRDDSGIRQVRIKDRKALEAVAQRVAQNDKPMVRRLLCGEKSNTERRIGLRLSCLQLNDDFVRCLRITQIPRYLIRSHYNRTLLCVRSRSTRKIEPLMNRRIVWVNLEGCVAKTLGGTRWAEVKYLLCPGARDS